MIWGSPILGNLHFHRLVMATVLSNHPQHVTILHHWCRCLSAFQKDPREWDQPSSFAGAGQYKVALFVGILGSGPLRAGRLRDIARIPGIKHCDRQWFLKNIKTLLEFA